MTIGAMNIAACTVVAAVVASALFWLMPRARCRCCGKPNPSIAAEDCCQCGHVTSGH